MYSLANTKISIFRGTVTDEFGDVVADNSTPASSGVLAFIYQGGAIPHDLNEQVPRVARITNLLVGSNTDIRTRDRVVDELRGDMYWVRYVEQANSPGQIQDIKVNLEKVD